MKEFFAGFLSGALLGAPLGLALGVYCWRSGTFARVDAMRRSYRVHRTMKLSRGESILEAWRDVYGK